MLSWANQPPYFSVHTWSVSFCRIFKIHLCHWVILQQLLDTEEGFRRTSFSGQFKLKGHVRPGDLQNRVETVCLRATFGTFLGTERGACHLFLLWCSALLFTASAFLSPPLLQPSFCERLLASDLCKRCCCALRSAFGSWQSLHFRQSACNIFWLLFSLTTKMKKNSKTFSCSVTFLMFCTFFFFFTINLSSAAVEILFFFYMPNKEKQKKKKGLFMKKKKSADCLTYFLVFWEHLLKAVCVLDHPVFLHLLLLGPVGPLSKKHTDDLGDSDRTDDEGIFSNPPHPNTPRHPTHPHPPLPPPPATTFRRQTGFAWRGKIQTYPSSFRFFSSLIFLHFLVLFLRVMDVFFLLFTRTTLFGLDVFCPSQLDVWTLHVFHHSLIANTKKKNNTDLLLDFAFAFSFPLFSFSMLHPTSRSSNS